ncbi:MAG: MBL fold metallo-hydrolase [Deinococcales bacterium]
MIEALSSNLWRLAIKSSTLPPFDHTNSYLIADKGVALLIDAPSPKPEALDLIREALAKAKVNFLKALVLSHTHPDHIEGVEAVQKAWDLPCYVHPLELERLQKRYALKSLMALQDTRKLQVGDVSVESLHTPGHSPGHLSFYLPHDEIVLAGDLLSANSSTWVGVPEGDVSAFLASLDRLAALKLKQIACGHGEVIGQPYERLRAVREHRLAREAEVLGVLKEGQSALRGIRERVYGGLEHPQLIKLAEASLLAHLYKLMQDLKVIHLGQDQEGPYALRT